MNTKPSGLKGENNVCVYIHFLILQNVVKVLQEKPLLSLGATCTKASY